MKPPNNNPSFTAEWHNDTYPSIDPSKPALSAKGKTVIITGGGRGLGPEFAKAFAKADAAHIALLGRAQSNLEKSKEAIQGEFPSTKITTHVANVADEAAVKKAADEVGPWDVLILNAGLASRLAPIAEMGIDEWWSVFETNVRGAVVVLQAFIPSRRQNAAVVGINAAVIEMPTDVSINIGGSAYASSKIAQARMLEHLASENPDLFVVSVHPGILKTDMLATFDFKDGNHPPVDEVNLPAHFLVWVTSPEGKFLKGRFVEANWDVDELKAKAKIIEESPQLLQSNILGWPYKS